MTETTSLAVIRAQKLLQSEPSLVSAYARERLRKALELASRDHEYAAKLVDIRV